MEGAALAAKRKHDADISLAWHGAAFSGAVQNGKLKDLCEYQGRDPAKPRTADDLLVAFQAFAEAGAPMTIRRVH